MADVPGPDPGLAVTHPRIVLWAILVAASSVMAASTCAIAGLPVIQGHLLPTQTETQWFIDVTPVALAALLLPAGALVDRYGRRRGLILGMLVMGGALVWSSLVSSPEELIVARLFVGIGAAAAFPGTLATLTTVFGEKERSRVVAMWAAAVFVGGSWGMVFAGGFVNVGWWGSFFVAVAVIVFGALVAIVAVVPETRHSEGANLDPVGAVLSLIAIGALVLGVIEAPVLGLDDPLVVSAFAVGALTLAGFTGWELTMDAPMLDLRLFQNRGFTAGTAGLILLYIGMAGWFFLAFQYFGVVFGWSPLEASLALVPASFGAIPFVFAGPRLVPRYGLRAVLTASLLVLGIAMLAVAYAGTTEEVLPLLASFFLMGVGLGLGQQPTTQAVVDGLPPAKQGIASAVNDTARELGMATGIAVMGACSNAAYRVSVDEDLARLGGPVTRVVRDSPSAGMAIADRGGPGTDVIHAAVVAATVAGWKVGMVIGAAIVFMSAILIYKGAPAPARALTSPLPGSTSS